MYRPLWTLLAFHIFERVNATLYLAYEPTSPAQNKLDGIKGWSPKPTEKPQFRGQARNDLLFKRESSAAPLATCGYVSGISTSPLVCGSGYACAYLTSPAPQYFACCPTTNGAINWDVCYYYSTCNDYNSQSAPASASAGTYVQSANPSEIWCAGNEPYCNTYFLSQEAQGSTYQALWCATTKTLIDVFDTYTSASASQPPTPSSVPVSTRSSSHPTSSSRRPEPSSTTTTLSPANVASTGTPSSQTSSGGSSTSSTPTATRGSEPGPAKTDTGAIAGGVVGGVAGIALLGAAIGYLIYRKKKQRVEPMREVSIYSQNYSSPGYSQNGGTSYHGYSNPNHANSYSNNY